MDHAKRSKVLQGLGRLLRGLRSAAVRFLVPALLCVGGSAIVLPPAALAQDTAAVTVWPTPAWGCQPPSQGATPAACNNNASSTVTTTNTFQTVFGLVVNGVRRGCTIQNNGSHSMNVFVGPKGLATSGTSVVVAAGTSFYCNINGGLSVLQDEIAITGTSGDAFTAFQY